MYDYENEDGSVVEIPVCYAQQFVIELMKVSGGNCFIHAFFHLKGELDIERFKLAVQKAYDFYDCLRMEPLVKDGRNYLRIRKNYKYELEIDEDIEGECSADRFENAKKKAIEEMTIAVNFENGAELTKTKLYKIAADEYCLRASVHHAVFDGVGGGVLVMKIMQAYANPDIEFEEAMSYREYIENMNDFYMSDKGKESVQYLQKKFCEGYQVAHLISKKDCDLTLGYDLLSVGDLIIDKKNLISIIKKYRVSPFIITLFTYQLALAYSLNMKDLFIYFADDNRYEENLKQALGLVAITVGSRLVISDENESIGELFQTYRNDFLSNQKNPLYPVLNTELAQTPFAVTYQIIAKSFKDIDRAIDVEYIELENGNRRYGNLFPLFGFEDKDKVILRFAFDTNLYPLEFVEAFKKNFFEIIDVLNNADSTRICDVNYEDKSGCFDNID